MGETGTKVQKYKNVCSLQDILMGENGAKV